MVDLPAEAAARGHHSMSDVTTNVDNIQRVVYVTHRVATRRYSWNNFLQMSSRLTLFNAEASNRMKDFFISYNKADKQWAEWIAWTLEELGYSVVIQAWDFRPGENFVLKMHESAEDTVQTIAVLSGNYLGAEYTNPEWAAAFARDPQGKRRVLIPVRVRSCEPKGLLQSIIHIDLVGQSEAAARDAVVDGLKERAKPAKAPAFPSERPIERVIKHPVKYPGASAAGKANSGGMAIPSNLPTGIPFFTGREDVLTRLGDALRVSGATALAQRQAISGLGGIGKTQTAIEYARRHRHEYKALLWAVAESKESLTSDFVAIAGVLSLPEANIQDQTFTVKAVKEWLELNRDWLLILDNADDPNIVEEFLPEISSGHLLITSRAQVFDILGILKPIELEEMSEEDSRDFLLRRTGRDHLPNDEAEAVARLAQELDYLPLALEQAGAYIKELRGSFKDYLASYKQRGLELLEKGHAIGKYRKSVRTTWSLNFQQVEQTSTASADLLRVSAFFNPDRIPSELISKGAARLGSSLSLALANIESDPLALDEVFRPLIQYSLIHRNRESKTYDIHRLVQAVLRDGLDETKERVWAESSVMALAHVFPDLDLLAPSEWYRIERLLPQAQTCAELIDQFSLKFPEAASLLNLAGRYLHLRGRLAETESLYDQALAIREDILDPNHLDVAVSLHNKAWLHLNKGEYLEADLLLSRSLTIKERELGTEHPEVASTLNKLGWGLVEQGRYADGERILKRSLNILEAERDQNEQILSAEAAGYLAASYIKEQRETEAEPLLARSLILLEKIFGPSDHRLASELNNMASVQCRKGNVEHAEQLFLRSIKLHEETFGSNYPLIGASLENLARLYLDQKRFTEAEILIERAVKIVEGGFGLNHPNMAGCLEDYAMLNKLQGRYTRAEPLLLRTLNIREGSLGEDHPDVGNTLVELARLYQDMRKYSKGEPLAKRATAILKKSFGPNHSYVARALFVHSDLLKGLNRKGEAQRLEAQARKLKAKLIKKQNSRDKP